jgi:predicted 2-oxoglutarate/Fe(II)-dependent dioxygenase YbiX
MTSITREELERGAAAGDDPAQLALADALDAEGKHTDAVNVLSIAARNGSALAMGRVGARILIGDRAPALPQQAIGLIADAARAGDPDAMVLLATLTAVGAYVQRSWSGALDLLQRAAERGSASARGQLAVLASDRSLAAEATASADASPPEVWRRLRATVDVAGFSRMSPGITLCEGPLIRSFPDFAAPEVCDWLVARAANRLKRAEVYVGDPTKVKVGESRTNSVGNFWLPEIDLVQLALQLRMAAATGLPYRHMESPTVLHYAVGQEFKDHYDFIDPATPSYEALIARHGERVVTFLVYLNDDYEGGETAFPRLDIAHAGARGEGLYFANALPAGGPDTRALHAGRPPTRGEKWVVSQFIRSHPFVPGAA